jgi:hypothetical protein
VLRQSSSQEFKYNLECKQRPMFLKIPLWEHENESLQAEKKEKATITSGVKPHKGRPSLVTFWLRQLARFYPSMYTASRAHSLEG